MTRRRLPSIIVCLPALLAALAAGVARAAEESPPASAPGHVSGLQERQYVYIRLDGPVPERDPLVYIFPPRFKTLPAIMRTIDQARQDSKVRGIFVHLGHPQLGWARAQEFRALMVKCRMSGKRVACFMEGGGNLEYYVASGADRLAIIPASSIMLVGVRAEVMFFKGLLDKLGVSPQFVQIGQFKGAAEPFLLDKMSDPFRSSMETLLDDYYEQLVEDVARARDMKVEVVRALIDRGPYTAEGARAAGLVDDVTYYDEFLARLGAEAPGPLRIVRDYGSRGEGTPSFSSPQQMLNMLMGMSRPAAPALSPDSNTIAVIHAIGPIIDGDEESLFGEQVVTVSKLVNAFGYARRHPGVKAVILRINSPGGSATASDQIWHEIERTNKVKPVIVSLSDVAASGGYYIAVAGRKILAEPGTITGSIGVVGGKMNIKGLYDKVGITVDVVQRGRHAGLFSGVSDFSDEERARVRDMMLETYRDFVQRVAAGRNRQPQQIDAVAQGRAWSGARALSLGLVDGLGGLDEALEIAKREAKIPPGAKIDVIELPRSRSLLEVVLGGQADMESLRLPVTPSLFGLPVEIPTSVRALASILSREPVFLMLPCEVRIR